MSNTDRRAELRRIYAQLQGLMSADDRGLYPVLEHLGDLIADLETGDD